MVVGVSDVEVGLVVVGPADVVGSADVVDVCGESLGPSIPAAARDPTSAATAVRNPATAVIMPGAVLQNEVDPLVAGSMASP